VGVGGATVFGGRFAVAGILVAASIALSGAPPANGAGTSAGPLSLSGSFLNLASPGKPSGRSAEVTVLARTVKEPNRVQALLNGKLVTAKEFVHPYVMQFRLDPTEGLRHGPNRLIVKSWMRDGTFARRVVNFNVDPNRVLADGGVDRHVSVGHPVALGNSSVRAQRGGKLGFKWSIVRRPAGSSAHLVHPNRERATLLATTPGEYVVRLTVKQHGAISGSDEVTVFEDPADPPIGVSLDTGSVRGRGITLGGVVKIAPPRGTAVQVLVLDRETHAVKQKANFRQGERKAGLAKILGAADPTDIVILNGAYHEAYAGDPILKHVFEQIGGKWDEVPVSARVAGSWSLIGATGLSPGNAWQSAIPLTGYLQVAYDSGQPQYQFAPGDYVSLDASGSSIQVGSARYTSPPPDNPYQEGFHVVVLDQYTLKPLPHADPRVTNGFFPTNTLTFTWIPNDVEINALRAELSRLLVTFGRPVIVFIQSVGGLYGDAPHGEDQAWLNLESTLKHFGNSQDVFNLLDQQSRYMFVGGTNIDRSVDAAEMSQKIDSHASPLRMTGVLSRNRHGQFVATNWSRLPGISDAFELAYRPVTPWPASNTPQLRAAIAYFAQQLGLPDPDVRRDYYLRPEIIDSTARSRIADTGDTQYIHCPSNRPDFTQADCEAVRAALIPEFTQVKRVYEMFRTLKTNYLTAYTTSIPIKEVTDAIMKVVRPPQKPGRFSTRGLIAAAMHAAEATAGEFGGQVFGIASAAIELDAAINGEPGPAPDPLPDEIVARSDEIGGKLNDYFAQLQLGLYHMRDILMSDPVKLATAEEKIRTGPWNDSVANFGVLLHGMRIALGRTIWSGIMPVIFKSYEVPHNPASAWRITCHIGGDKSPSFTYNPFGDAPNGGQFQATVGFDGLRPTSRPKVLAFKTGPIYAGFLTDDMIDELFTTKNRASTGRPGLGYTRPQFFDQFEQKPAGC
jgi:hypothetical protein